MRCARVAIILVGLAAVAAADPLPPHLDGPRTVQLATGIELDLPAGMRLYETAVAKDIVREVGGDPAVVIALVEPAAGTWSIGIEYDADGYVEDSDAEDLDADELLESYKQGIEQQNEHRKAVGAKPLHIDAWFAPPRYLRAQHALVWSLAGHDDAGRYVNDFTRVLGRHGYLSIQLIDTPERIVAAKQAAAPVLRGLRFQPGWRYEDHAAGDRSSGGGLRALVLGGAGIAVAAKLGILGKLLLLLKSGVLVIVAAIGGAFAWLARRRNKRAAQPPR